MKKIDYVVISSNDDPLYKDFYPIVSKRWYDLGFKTYYVHITNENSISKNEYGIVHKIKAIEGINTGFQSQVVRLYTSKFIEGNLLMSDIDMLPINGEYYNSYNDELTDDNVIVFSGQPYGNVPYYPMCYVLSHSKNFVNYLGLENLDFQQYCRMLLDKYGQDWNTDEHFMYDMFQNHIENIILKERDLTKRVDRGFWTFDVRLLQKGYYIDSHMLRPYSQYKNYLDELVQIINTQK